jgi:hypothetical protein
MSASSKLAAETRRISPSSEAARPLFGRLDLGEAHLLHLVEHERVERQALCRH